MLKKRMSGIMLAVCLLMTTIPVQGEEVFQDTKDHSYEQAIMKLYHAGIVRGVGNKAFEPDRTLTNAQALQLLVNMFDLNLETIRFMKAPLATDYYKNADNLAWYADAFITAGVHGLMTDETIMPSDAISRESFYGLLITTMENQYPMPMINLLPVPIKDEAALNVSGQGAIQRGISYGIIQLDSQSNLKPREPITRGEAAEAVSLALDYLEDKNYIVLGEDFFVTHLDSLVKSEGINFQFDLYNTSDVDQTITYGSSQTFDMNIYNANEEQVYNWASNKSFLMMLQDLIIESGSYMRYEITWDYKDLSGMKLAAGTYKVVVDTHFEHEGNPIALDNYVYISVPE